MRKYLGEFEVDINETEYKDYGPVEWGVYFCSYGQVDGSHHKTWAIDQVVRVLKGTPVIIKEARWDDGKKEFRINLGEPSQAYLDYVKDYEGEDEDGEKEYEWDTGGAP